MTTTEMSHVHENYRLGVGIVLARAKRQVFVGHRISAPQYAHFWQMPQGGIDPEEDPDVAMWRELAEETGIQRAHGRLIDQTDWLFYDIPATLRPHYWRNKYIGQRQKWYLVEFLGQDNYITLDNPEAPAEFDAWKWLSFDDIDQHVVPFKQDMYRQIQQHFARSIDRIATIADR